MALLAFVGQAAPIPEKEGGRVEDAVLELGVAVTLVSKNACANLDAFTAGQRAAPAPGHGSQEVFGGFREYVTGQDNGQGAEPFVIRAGLSQVLAAFAEKGVSLQREYGTMRFHANGGPGKTLHLGGTIVITPPATGEGDAPEPQNYDYGIKVINRNSRRLGENMAEADVEIEFKGMPVPDPRFDGWSVRQETRVTNQTIRVPLGQTVAVAGYESLVKSIAMQSGPAMLRHTPILNWFVPGQGEAPDDRTVLLLLSMRKVDANDTAPMVPNSPLKDFAPAPATDH